MKINVFGLGYVGCISAACLANEGHRVTGIDIDKTKVSLINKGKNPVIEPGLEEMMQKAVTSGKLRAGLNNFRPADVSIVCVGTPNNENGSLELGYIKRVAEQIGRFMNNIESYHVVNIRSTVLPGTVDEVVIPLLEEFSKKKAKKDFGVCMNPEFLREGTSIFDYYNPPYTVIGEWDKRSGDVVENLYKGVNAPVFRTTIRAAEMIKYACNAFHALKISFANEVGNICKKLNIDSHEVMDVFCRDTKLNISPVYLKPGFAFGGSCLPKDLRALLHKSRELDLELPVLGSILESNKNQLEVAYKLVAKTGKKRVGLLGLSFKPETDDLRESPMVELAEKLIGKGYDLSIYDKEVSLARIFGSNKKYIEKVIPHISNLMKKSIREVVRKSDVIVLTKKDKEYESLSNELCNGKVLIDLARIDSLHKVGTLYEGICW